MSSQSQLPTIAASEPSPSVPARTGGQLGGENVGLETSFAVLQAILVAVAIGRVGLLGTAAMWLYRIIFSILPMPVPIAAPYTPATVVVLGLMLALAAYAVRISVGSRPLFSVAALDD